jgi:phosphoenolpyruvate carboxykinase (GTP)
MRTQFTFFNSPDFTHAGRPILAGLNYFLTEGARGGEGTKLLGEKRDVKVWLSWLARFAHGEVQAIETPIGFVPEYKDLKQLFASLIDKQYSRELYDRQFSIYIDNILARIELQREAFGKEKNLPEELFKVYDEWTAGLLELKEVYGNVVTPNKLVEAAV